MSTDQPTAVLLRHDTPDGDHHFDLFLDTLYRAEPDDPRLEDIDERTLLAFRIRAPLHLPDSDKNAHLLEAFDALALPLHRRRYLQYEGPLTSNRGQVSRLAQGRVLDMTRTEDALDAKFTLAGVTRHYRAHRTAPLTQPSPQGERDPQPWRFDRVRV